MSLNATVQKLRNQAEDRRAIVADPGGFIETWQKDVDALYQRFADALKPFVDDGVAQVYNGTTSVREDHLGTYPIRTLIIEIVGRRMFLLPIARLTIAGTGRLDLYRDDRPSEDDRVLVTRGTEAAGFEPNTWCIEDKRPVNAALTHGLMGTVGMLRGGRRYRGVDTITIQDGVDYLLNL